MGRVETVVVGGGQAGLATSYHLSRSGRDHVVLEARRVAEAWRSRRWDTFTLVGPNWTMQMPGMPYAGPEPHGYLRRDEIVEYFEAYARSFTAPLAEGVHVLAVKRGRRDRYVVESERGDFDCANVVVATGPYQRPKVPAAARALDPDVAQITSDAYRNPGVLPDGAVLVVGSGQSGCQIAEDLREAGRTVYLSTGGTGWFPRRYRGRDNVLWREEMGFFDATVDTLRSLADRLAPVPIQTGKGGGHDLNLRTLARDGVILAGRFTGGEGSQVHFADDPEDNVRRSDDVARRLMLEIDDHIRRRGDVAPVDDSDFFFWPRIDRVGQLDLKQDRVSTIIWAIGYELDLGWVRLPVFDEYGYPIQRRGVTHEPGLAFVGLHWMYTRKSGLIWGAGDDAAHVVSSLVTAVVGR